MWQEEQGFLELFLAYFEQYKNNLAYGKQYREFLLDILLCHERVIRSCGLLPELDDYRSNIMDEMPILEPQVIVVEHCDEEDELGSSIIITKMEMLPQEDSAPSSVGLFGLEPPCKESPIAEDGKNGMRVANSTPLRCKLEMVDSVAQNATESSESMVDESSKARNEVNIDMEATEDYDVDFEGPNCLDQPPIFHQNNDASLVEEDEVRMPSPGALGNMVNDAAKFHTCNEDLDSFSNSQPPAKKAALEMSRSIQPSVRGGVENIPPNGVSRVPPETHTTEPDSNASHTSSQTTSSVTIARRSYICSHCKRLFRTQDLFKRHPCVIAYERGISHVLMPGDGSQNANVFPERDTFVSKIQTERNQQHSSAPAKNIFTPLQLSNSQTTSTQASLRTTLSTPVVQRNLSTTTPFSNVQQNNSAAPIAPLYLMRAPGTGNPQMFPAAIPGTQTGENGLAQTPFNSASSTLTPRYPPTQLSTQSSMNLIGQQRIDQASLPSNQNLPDFNTAAGNQRNRVAGPSQTSLPPPRRFQNIFLSQDNPIAVSRFQQQLRQFNNFQVENRQSLTNQQRPMVPIQQLDQQQPVVQLATIPAQNQQRQVNNSVLLLSQPQQQQMAQPFRNQEHLNAPQDEQLTAESALIIRRNLQATHQEAIDLSRNQTRAPLIANLPRIQKPATLSTTAPTQNQQLRTTPSINPWNPRINEISLHENSTNAAVIPEWNQRTHEHPAQSDAMSNASLIAPSNQGPHELSTASYAQPPDVNQNKTSFQNKRTWDSSAATNEPILTQMQQNRPGDTRTAPQMNERRMSPSGEDSLPLPVYDNVTSNPASTSLSSQRTRETSGTGAPACEFINLAETTTSSPQEVRETTLSTTSAHTSQIPTSSASQWNQRVRVASVPATSLSADLTTTSSERKQPTRETTAPITSGNANQSTATSASQQNQRARMMSMPATTSVYTDLTTTPSSVSEGNHRTREIPVPPTTSVYTDLTTTTTSVSQRNHRTRETSVPPTTSVYTDLTTTPSSVSERNQKTPETPVPPSTSVYTDLTTTPSSVSERNQRTREIPVPPITSVYTNLTTTTSSISQRNQRTRETSVPSTTSVCADLTTTTSSVSLRSQRTRESVVSTSQLHDNELTEPSRVPQRNIRMHTGDVISDLVDEIDQYHVPDSFEKRCKILEQKKRQNERNEVSDKNLYNIPPFQCNYCHREFTRISDRRRHEKTHDASRKCLGCGKDYARPSSLRAHESKCKLLKLRSTETREPMTASPTSFT